MDFPEQKKSIIKWNRKIHIYLGLFILLFIWLFGLSGILLNHHWDFANSWEKRKVSTYTKIITISAEREKQQLVQEIIGKLSLNGNIFSSNYSVDSLSLTFVAAKPGVRYDVQASLSDGIILIKESDLDQWDVMRALHKLRNPTKNEIGRRYQSGLSSIWSLSLDIVALCFIVICLGGCYMWLQLSGRRFYFGLMAVSAGVILTFYLLFL